MAQGRYVLTSDGAFHLERAAITCILKHNYGSLEPLLTSRLMIYFDCVSLSGRAESGVVLGQVVEAVGSSQTSPSHTHLRIGHPAFLPL